MNRSTAYERNRALELRSTPAKHTGPHRHKAPAAQALRCSSHEAGISPRHAEGDGVSGVAGDGALSGVTGDSGLSGMTGDGESYAFISVPASFAGSTPVTRARIPCSMPEASL
jgi:hypothetical protein